MHNKNDIYSQVLLLFAINAFFYFTWYSLREFILFRDYSIIFEGSRRIAEGERIYADFGVPVGPITFILTAKWFNLVGISWHSMQSLQQVLNFFFILSVFSIARKQGKSIFHSHIVCISAMLLTTFFWPFPWYNSTSVIFGVAALAIFQDKIWTYILSGILLTLSILSKQDIGLVLTCACISLLFFECVFQKHKDIKLLIKQVIITFTSLLISMFMICSYFGPEIYFWMNPSNYDYSQRLDYLIDAVTSWRFFVAIIISLYGIKNKDNLSLTAGITLLASSLTVHTSGMPLSHFYYVPFIISLLLSWKRLISSFMGLITILACITSLIHPSIRLIFAVENLIQTNYEGAAINFRKITGAEGIINLEECSEVYANIYAPDVCFELQRPFAELTRSHGSLINYTELSPKTLWTLDTIKDVPLWPHQHTSVPQEYEQRLVSLIEQRQVDFLLLQPVYFAGRTKLFMRLKEALIDPDSGYRRLPDIISTPSSVACPKFNTCNILRFVLE